MADEKGVKVWGRVGGFQLETNSSLSDSTWIEFVTRHSPPSSFFVLHALVGRIKRISDVCPAIVEHQQRMLKLSRPVQALGQTLGCLDTLWIFLFCRYMAPL